MVDPRKTKLETGYTVKTVKLGVALRRHRLVRVRARLMQTPVAALLLRPDAGDPPVARFVSPTGLRWLETRVLPGAAGETLRGYVAR